ncbi:pyrroloquinoline quinone-dependent dehydrogenase [Aurantimonas sp. 22II-16-19i]|uniref:pyrroloquinoline quinone-dependent dehydrogenase n=1 Tax=Aurantimonas sp. 22II-16-19i TaxID=1317114 RepID=UPI0009F7F982|nr:pyrroloquinoline quinone-dependent dehydrogenase [Aurantimonas sp. 22II-16-19i]ORE87630.1 quinoprotein glucose dehydrogenase [Aurantimonas sp. 22II-16-19i]
MKIAKTAASSAALALIFSLAAPALAQDGGQTPEAPQYGATQEPGGASDGEAETSGTEVDPNRADDTGPTATGQDAADPEAGQNGSGGAAGSGEDEGSDQAQGAGQSTQTPNLTTEETQGGGSVDRPAGSDAAQAGEAGEAGATAQARQRQEPDAWMETPDSWATFNGDLRAQKYSPADQITPENVDQLEKVWEYHTGDVSDGSGDIPTTVWSATPLFVNDTLYIGTPFYRIIALEPDTGKEKWAFDPHARLEALTQPAMKNRGVAYWQADEIQEGEACQKMVYIGTMDAKLYGVDADTGKPCADFGTDGMLDVNQWNTVNDKWPLSLLQAATVYHDTLFLGWAGKDWTNSAAPPGTVFALDARTGKLKWMFHALPNEVLETTGTANVWASMSIDPERGLLYLPISSPSPNYYGGERKEKLPLATSVTALDTETGKVAWSRQLIHHDIWDYDTVAPPTLVDIQKDGKTVPALVQTSKQGFIYVLDRETGEPVYPIEERPVPASDVPGEEASPTQPFVDRPAPVIGDDWPGVDPLADAVSFGECSRRAEGYRWEGRFTPPSLQGTIAYPPTTGGSQWGGGAVDPETGIYVVNSNSVVQIYTLIPREEFEQGGQEGETSGYYAQGDAPYAFKLETFLNWAGMPCWKGPYGTIAAYDLKTGDRLWNEPFGQVQKYGFYMPESWGSVTIGGPVITKSGLIFIGASMDSRVRALDLATGEVLWKGLVDAPAVALPAVYTYKGRQYVTFVVGGNTILLPKVSDQVVTFALPE